MPSPITNALSRADWFAARALLASRRLRRFVPVGLLAFALVFVASLALRSFLIDRVAAQHAAIVTLGTQRDTVPLVVDVRAARSRFATQDSALQALLFRVEARAAAPTLAPASQRARDSLRALIVQLDGALGRATRAPLAGSYRALAGTDAMRSLNGVPPLLDSLDALDRARLTLGPAETPQREFAQLTQRANAIGVTLQEIGQARRSVLVRQISTLEGSAPIPARRAGFAADSTAVRLARDSARASVVNAELLLREVRQQHAIERTRADSAADVRSRRLLGVSPAVVAIAALLVASVLSFALAVIAEARHPTIAHAREVERVTGVPVLGTAHPGDLPAEGRARLRLGVGIDPFRMVYLALTASGTRERTVCITGDDPDAVAAVAGRLAVSAAADAHATLVVDAAPGTPSVTRYYGERHEPGFSEAIAAIRLWREVARPVGASEGLGLDIVPAGARRADTLESVAMASNRREFHLFSSEYDFTVVAAPTHESVATVAMLCEKPATIYVARIAQTPVDALADSVRMMQSMALDLHGVLLIDRTM